MIKEIFFGFFLCIISIITLTSCEDKSETDGMKDEIVKDIEGTWEIYDKTSDSISSGIIIFNHDETFEMITDRGNVHNGNFSRSLNDNEIVITWAEDEDGNEIMTDEDYENGYFCHFEYVSEKAMFAENIPLYRGEKILLMKK